MFKWIGRSKRIESKLDEVLSYYNRPAAGSAPRPIPQGGTDPILMTEEREERIRQEADTE